MLIESVLSMKASRSSVTRTLNVNVLAVVAYL